MDYPIWFIQTEISRPYYTAVFFFYKEEAAKKTPQVLILGWIPHTKCKVYLPFPELYFIAYGLSILT